MTLRAVLPPHIQTLQNCVLHMQALLVVGKTKHLSVMNMQSSV